MICYQNQVVLSNINREEPREFSRWTQLHVAGFKEPLNLREMSHEDIQYTKYSI